MSAARSLVHEADELDVRVFLKDGDVRLVCRETPPADFIARLRANKAEIVALLRNDTPAEPTPPSPPAPASIEERRAHVETLLDRMAAENEQRREWYREPVEVGRVTIRSTLTGEIKTIELANGRVGK